MGIRPARPGETIGPEFDFVIAGCRAGRSDAFARLWRTLQPPLLRYLYVVAGDGAEDLASETWLEVARSLDRFNGDEAGFRGWLFTIARHRHLDWIRRERRRPPTSPTSDVPEQRADDDPADAAVATASTAHALELIRQLPPDQAEAIALRVIADLDVSRVAELMDREPGAVRVLTHRGLRRLAQQTSALQLTNNSADGVTR